MNTHLKRIHQPFRKVLPEENTARPLPPLLYSLIQLNNNQSVCFFFPHLWLKVTDRGDLSASFATGPVLTQR